MGVGVETPNSGRRLEILAPTKLQRLCVLWLFDNGGDQLIFDFDTTRYYQRHVGDSADDVVVEPLHTTNQQCRPTAVTTASKPRPIFWASYWAVNILMVTTLVFMGLSDVMFRFVQMTEVISG